MDMLISLIRFVVAGAAILAVSTPIMKGAVGMSVWSHVLAYFFCGWFM
jgi:hypothetical protein